MATRPLSSSAPPARPKSGSSAPPQPSIRWQPSFVALDFETATRDRESACAIALVRVEEGRIVQRVCRLIRPPSPAFEFTYLHGIDWRRVRNEPTFGELWPSLRPLFEGVEFVAAHNASFDRGVLSACCAYAGLADLDLRFECTMKLARATWELYPTTLKHVADFLGLPLQHHDAASDAEVCARIVLAATKAQRAA